MFSTERGQFTSLLYLRALLTYGVDALALLLLLRQMSNLAPECTSAACAWRGCISPATTPAADVESGRGKLQWTSFDDMALRCLSCVLRNNVVSLWSISGDRS